MLANIWLDDLDRELERRGHRFVPCADDVLVLVNSERARQRVMASLTRYLALAGKLKLPVNQDKSRVAPMEETAYLGFTFRGTKLRWSAQAFADFKHWIRELNGRSWGVSIFHRKPHTS